MAQVTPKQVYKRWIDALRSGKYKQSDSQLRHVDRVSGEKSYCCLGVLQDLAAKDGGAGWDTVEGTHNYSDRPREEILNFLGLEESMVDHLIEMNDDKGYTFKEIARDIELNIMPATGN